MSEKQRLQEIQDELKKVLGLKKTIRDLGPDEVRAYERTLENLIRNNRELKAFEQLQKQINRDLIEAQSAISGIRDAFAASVNELTGMNAGLNRAKKSFKGLESLADKLSNDQADISRMSLKELKTIEEKVQKRHQELKVAKFTLTAEIDNLKSQKNLGAKEKEKLRLKQAALNSTQQELSDFKNGVGLSQALVDQAKNRIQAEQTIIKTMGMAPAILEGVGKSLQKIGLPDFGVTEAVSKTKDIIRLKNEEFDLARKIQIEATKENVERLKNSGATKKRIDFEEKKLEKLQETEAKRVSSMGALSTLAGEIGKKIKDQLSFANLLQGGFTLLVSAMVQVDKATGALAKNIGVSYDESLALQKEFNQIAMSSDRIMVSSAALNKSFASLNQQFQGITRFSDDTLESFTALTAQAGFSEETIGSISKLTGTQGKALENNVELMQGELQVMNAQNKTSFSSKQLLEDIGKISKATLLTLRNQPKALSRSLYTSRKLAISFAEMESIASSMLDFESSIQNELEAELLTGKDLNLEQARLLALKGDVAGASAEIAKQVGTAADFENMNVIQQEALAKAAGLTREQLANSLIEREALNKIGKEDETLLESYNNLRDKGLSQQEIAKKLGDERLAAQLESQSVAERFGAAVERIKELFINVGEAIMPIISMISNFAGGVAKLVTKFPLLTKSIVAAGIALKLYKSYTGSILSNQLKINMASKLGLITEEQKGLLKKANLATDVAAAQNQRGINIAKKLGLITEEQAGILKKGNLATDIAANSAERVNNTLNATGNKIEKRGLLAKIGGAVTSAMEAVFSGPGKLLGPFAIPLALAAGAAIGAIGYSFMKDGEIDPQKGPTMFTKKGAVQLDPKDKAAYDANGKIKVGTDLFGGGEKISGETSSPSVEKGPSSQLLKDLNSKLDQLLVINRRIVEVAGSRRQDKITVKMFGNEVGNGVQTDSRGIN